MAETLGPDPDCEPDDTQYITGDISRWAQLWYKQPEHDDLDEGIAHLPLSLFEFDYDAATWHHNTIDTEAIVRAHILRIAHGWEYCKSLHTYLKQQPHLLGPMGLDSIPDQSTLSRAWKKFGDDHQEAIEEATLRLVGVARYYDVPAPARAFRTQQELEQQGPTPSKRALTVRKTKQTWEEGKPIIKENFWLKRGPNASIPEYSFWYQQARSGLEGDAIHAGAKSSDYTSLETPSGWTQRRELHKLTVEDIRESIRGTARELIEKAQRKSKLNRGVTVGIDTTKERREFVGDIERDEDGKNLERWIMGYKDEGTYFQYATVQIVGDDVPIVLDEIPVPRGMKRYEIVDTLLSEAKHLINIDEVQTDREFDNNDVRRVVEDHGMVFRMPGKKEGAVKGICTELRRAGKRTHIVEEGGVGDTTPWKTIYVPAHNTEVFDQADAVETDEDQEEDQTVQEELVEDFGDVIDEEPDDTERMFEDFLEEVEDEEEERVIRGNDADVGAYAVFKTNDPDVSVDDYETDQERDEAAARAVRPYSNRWAIEEGNKKIKEFAAKSRSRDHELRFFNFAFGTCLYNMWRIVDLLVQLSMEEQYDYSTDITSSEFLSCAKENFDFDNPPPSPTPVATV